MNRLVSQIFLCCDCSQITIPKIYEAEGPPFLTPIWEYFFRPLFGIFNMVLRTPKGSCFFAWCDLMKMWRGKDIMWSSRDIYGREIQNISLGNPKNFTENPKKITKKMWRGKDMMWAGGIFMARPAPLSHEASCPPSVYTHMWLHIL